MNKREIIERLKNIAGHAVHTVGEKPFILSLDDGIALHEAIDLLKKQEPLTDHEPAIDYLHKTGWLQNHDRILTEHEQMYKKAFSVACELLIGSNLFGTTEGTMFKEIMEKMNPKKT